MMLVWGLLRGLAPWHLVVAGVAIWSGFVGVKAYRAGVARGDAKIATIERAADANVKKAETARRAVHDAERRRPGGVRDPDRRD